MKTEHERLSIGKVAEGAGVNRETLRFYERRGLLRTPRRTASGYRSYPSDTVALIRFIKRAQDLGFTLDEVEDLLALRESGAAPQGTVRSIAETKLKSVEEKMRRLQRMRRVLRDLLDACACEGGSGGCPILDALNDEAPTRPARRRDVEKKNV